MVESKYRFGSTEPKAAEHNPLVFLGICLDQHASEAQGEDFDSKMTRYTEAVEICKHQAGTGETCELLVNLPFECDCKVFLLLSPATQQKQFISLQCKSLIHMTMRALTLYAC